MASIFDVEEKQPITIPDLMKNQFRLMRPKNGKPGEYEWVLYGYTTNEIKTWVAKYYAKGQVFKGKKLRSNKLIYKVFDVEKSKAWKNKKANVEYRRKGYYSKKYVRNIGLTDLLALVSILPTKITDFK
jgi:hypothetical protein